MDSTQGSRTVLATRTIVRAATIIVCFASIVGFPLAAHAKLETITLAQLVHEADVVLYGRIVERTTMSSQADRSVVAMKPIEILKNKGGVNAAVDVPICNDGDAESVDFYSNPGTYIVFVSKVGSCYSPIAGLNSVVVVKGKVVHTRRVQGQPAEQSLKAFVKQVRALIEDPAKED